MLLLKSFTSDDRSIVPPLQDSYLSRTSLPLLSLRIRVLHPNTRIDVRLLGPCFKTGRLKPLCQHPGRKAPSSSIPIAVSESRSITHPEGCHIPPTFIRRSKLMLTRQPRSAPSRSKVESRPTRLTSNVSLSTISRTV